MRNGWQLKKLGDFISEYSVKNKCNETIPVYSVTNSQGFCKDYFSKEVASQDKSTYKIVPYGCFAYNPSRINVGSVDWQNKEERVIVSPLYTVFSVSENLNRDFLLYFIKSNGTMGIINSLATGTVRLNLKLSMLKEFQIIVPPLSDQKSIVEELNTINELIRLKKEQLEDYDNLAQSIFYEMFGDPVVNEKGWEKKRLGEVCSEIKYGTSKPACDNGKYKYLRMCNLSYDGYLDLTDIKRIDVSDEEIEKCIVRYGDILFNRTNSQELIGKTCMFDQQEPMVIAGYIIRVRLTKELMPQVFARMFNLASIKKLLRSMAKGAVNQANINSKELASIQIPIPSLDLQQHFVKRIELIEQQKEEIQNTIADLETLLASRMQYWFD